MMKTFFRKISRIFRLFFWCISIAFRARRVLKGLDFWQKVQRVTSCTEDWARGILKILNIKVTVIHGERCPEDAGFLIVSNHLGYSDILVHASFRGIRFAPNDGIRKWPLFGPLTALSMPIWVDRKNRSKSAATMKEFEETLDHGVPLIVYPEGTTTDGFHGMLPFKSAAFEAALKGNHLILPVITSYRDADGKMNPAWYDDTPFIRHLWRFLGIRELHATLLVGEPFRADGLARKELALKAHEIMERLYCEAFPDYRKEEK